MRNHALIFQMYGRKTTVVSVSIISTLKFIRRIRIYNGPTILTNWWQLLSDESSWEKEKDEEGMEGTLSEKQPEREDGGPAHLQVGVAASLTPCLST